MSKKKTITLIIIISVVLLIAVTIVLLLPHQAEWKGVYRCCRVDDLNPAFADADLAEDVLECVEIECDFTVTANPISYKGKGTVKYNGIEYWLTSVNVVDNTDKKRLAMVLERENTVSKKWVYMSEDLTSFFFDDVYPNYSKWWVVVYEGNPTIGEICKTASKLGYSQY